MNQDLYTVNLCGNPTRSDYIFNGWCTDAILTYCGMSQSISTSDSGNKIFYAKWTSKVETCNSKYGDPGMVINDGQKYIYYDNACWKYTAINAVTTNFAWPCGSPTSPDYNAQRCYTNVCSSGKALSIGDSNGRAIYVDYVKRYTCLCYCNEGGL